MTPESMRTPDDPLATPTLPGPTLPQETGSNSANLHRVEPVSHEAPSTEPYLGSTPEAPNIAPPGFEILGVLGRGGMGVVYHARQTKLNREVALKMILSGGHAGEDDRARFVAEAEAIAALNHPGIVQVYEFGTHAGQPYFALEFCPGGSL